MREEYTYDDEIPSSQGSFMNRSNSYSRIKKFTGDHIGTIHIDPETKQIVITPDSKEEFTPLGETE